MKLDWRVVLGICLTVIWLTIGVFYLIGVVGFYEFVLLPTGDIGSFLEGAFAPLAFLWLVIGHFMQQAEISANTQAIREQEENVARQELHSRRNSFFRLLGLVQNQLGSVAGLHYMSVCGDSGTGEICSEEYARMREESANTDPTLFIKKMITLVSKQPGNKAYLEDIFFATKVRRRHTEYFESTFKKLLNAAEAVDHEGMVVEAILHGSPAGLLFRIIRYLKGEEQAEPLYGFVNMVEEDIEPILK